jgi:hypothetical protein
MILHVHTSTRQRSSSEALSTPSHLVGLIHRRHRCMLSRRSLFGGILVLFFSLKWRTLEASFCSVSYTIFFGGALLTFGNMHNLSQSGYPRWPLPRRSTKDVLLLLFRAEEKSYRDRLLPRRHPATSFSFFLKRPTIDVLVKISIFFSGVYARFGPPYLFCQFP